MEAKVNLYLIEEEPVLWAASLAGELVWVMDRPYRAPLLDDFLKRSKGPSQRPGIQQEGPPVSRPALVSRVWRWGRVSWVSRGLVPSNRPVRCRSRCHQ